MQPVQNVNDIVKNRADKTEPKFDKQMEQVEDIPRLAQIALATCHAVTTLNGQFIGRATLLSVTCLTADVLSFR